MLIMPTQGPPFLSYFEMPLTRGLRWCHGELVHWRKEKRRVRKLALLNAKQRRLAAAVAVRRRGVLAEIARR